MGIDHTAVLAYGLRVTLPDGVDTHPEEYFAEVAARYDGLELITAGAAEGGNLEYVIGTLLGEAEGRSLHGFRTVDVLPSSSDVPQRVLLATEIVKLGKNEKDLNPEGPAFYLGLWVY